MGEQKKFYGQDETLSDPSDDWFEVTPDDDAPLEEIPKYIFVGTGGDLVIKSENGSLATLKTVADGSWHPIRPKWIMEASTAEDIVAFT